MRGRILGSLGAALAALAVGAALALAGGDEDPDDGDDFTGLAGGVRYAQDSQLADSAGAALAGCGSPKRHLIGGGTVITGLSDQSSIRGGRGWDHQDADDDFDEGWYGVGSGPAPAVLSVTAICRKGPVRYRVKVLGSGPAERVVEIGCGGPAWHVTAGSPFLPQSENHVNSSYPIDGKDRDRVPDDGWRVRILSGTGSPNLYAMCIRSSGLSYRKSAAVTMGTTGSAEIKTRQVGCGRRHAVGGGARVSGLINRGRLVASGPLDGADPDDVPDDRWFAKAHNLGGTETRLTGFAICLK